MARRLKHWGWGYEDEQLSESDVRAAATAIADRLGFGSTEPEHPVPLSEVRLPAPRLQAPDELAGFCHADTYERALHTYGRSYRDLIRAFRGRFERPYA